MSSPIGLGVPVPKILPVTGTWTLPFAAYLLVLSNRVMWQRVKHESYIGDSIKRSTKESSSAPKNGIDPLTLAARCHGNFIESVPLALLVAAITELNGGSRAVLNYALATLFALRIVHAEFGLRKGGEAMGWGRPVGFFGTMSWFAGMTGYSAWLVKGYWGY
ncbi:MAG: hypothetical protein LQ342_006973 [Letrouitia transgressa]|nr:MAG: hypothetical protein LQ342_006973 [Letrouitia transgressa]